MLRGVLNWHVTINRRLQGQNPVYKLGELSGIKVLNHPIFTFHTQPHYYTAPITTAELQKEVTVQCFLP